jgi:hypothetical protein
MRFEASFKQRKFMPSINFILLAWIQTKNIKFRYMRDGSFVDKWRQTGYLQIMIANVQ